MSVELMKSSVMKFICRPSVHPSVCDTIISEPNARFFFKFWLLLPLGHTLGLFFEFFEIFFFIFTNIFPFR